MTQIRQAGVGFETWQIDHISANNIGDRKTKQQKRERANPKEIVYLDDESDSSSAISISDNSIPEEQELDGNNEEESASETPNDISLREEEDIENQIYEEDDIGNSYDLQLAEDYFNRQNGIIVCRKCGGLGHKAADCPNVQTLTPCILCAETDHLAKDCPYTICRQ